VLELICFVYVFQRRRRRQGTAEAITVSFMLVPTVAAVLVGTEGPAGPGGPAGLPRGRLTKCGIIKFDYDLFPADPISHPSHSIDCQLFVTL